MAYKPKDWLGHLLEDEIKAASAWYEREGGLAHIKKDPGSRFEDDGSNLRSHLGASQLPQDNTVQIVNVLSAEEGLMTITDGFTSIRAHLSTGAVSALETEVGDKIDPDTKGDVFEIHRCVVVSTPYGPTDSQVQLIIEEIGYQYHLRKVAGIPISVRDRPEISRLMNGVMRLRHPEVIDEPAVGDQSLHSSDRQRSPRRSDRFETQAQLQSPSFQADSALISSPSASQPGVVIATQTTSRQRKTAPNIDRDGIELVTGVNLARPTAANPIRPTSNHSSSARPRPVAVSDRSAHLLSVLGKRKASPDAAPQSKTSEADGSKHPTAVANAEDPASSMVNSGHGLESPSVQPPAQPGTNAPAASQPKARSLDKGTQEQSGSRLARAHWQRQIPQDQRSLLENATSWLPPLPGRQFPHPNVPMETLKQWNHEAQTRPKSVVLSQTRTAPSQAPENGESVASESKESTDNDSDSAAELPWSSSPPRPAARSAMSAASPAGSRGSSGHSSPISSSLSERLSSQVSPSPRPSSAGQRPNLPPDSSWERPVAPRALGSGGKEPARRQQSRSIAPGIAADNATSTGHISSDSTVPREQVMPEPPISQVNSSRTSTPRQESPTTNKRPDDSVDSRPLQQTPGLDGKPVGNLETASSLRSRSIKNSPASKATPAHASKPLAHTSPDVEILHVSQSPAHSRTARNAVSPSTSATVIEGTQVGRDSDVDIIEIEPPGPVDPTLEHRKRRSEYFKGEQRRKWIRANYKPNGTKQVCHLSVMYGLYKKAFPKDQVRLSELAEAYEAVFPASHAEEDSNRHNSAQSSNKPSQAANVVSTAESTRPSLADIDMSDATPTKAPTEPSAQRRRELQQRSPAMSSLSGRLTIEGQVSPQIQVANMSNPPSIRAAGITKTQISPAGLRGAAKADPAETPSPNVCTTAKQVRTDCTASEAARMPIQAMQPAQASPAGSARPAVNKTKGLPDHHAWFIKCIERNQRRLREDLAAAERGAGKDGSESIVEFAQAWREIRPGGAFARDDGAGRGESRRRGKRLDVLRWEL